MAIAKTAQWSFRRSGHGLGKWAIEERRRAYVDGRADRRASQPIDVDVHSAFEVMKKSTGRQSVGANSSLRFPTVETSSNHPGDALDRPMPWTPVMLRLLTSTAAILTLCGLVAVVLYRGPETVRLWWLSETGPVEMASGWGYLLVAVALWTTGAIRWANRRRGSSGSTTIDSHRSRTDWYPFLLGACAAMLSAREFDWHNLWTTQGILKTRFYVDPAIPIQEKFAAVAVLVLIGILVGTTVRAYAGSFLQQLRRGGRAAGLAATGLILLPVSKSLDSAPRLLGRLLGDDPTNAQRFLGSLEELMELAIPALFLIATLSAAWPRRADETASPDADQPEIGQYEVEQHLRRAA